MIKKLNIKKESFSFFKVYVISWLCIFTIFLFNVLARDITIKRAFEIFFDLLLRKGFLIFSHSVILLIYIIFLIVRYFIRLFKIKGWKITLRRLFLRVMVPVLIVYGTFKWIRYQNIHENFDYQWDETVENQNGYSKDLFNTDGKHRGMSVFGWRKENNDIIDNLVKNNIEWAAIIPYMYQENEESNHLRNRRNKEQWSRQDSTFIHVIKELHKKGMHAHVKPHLWLGDGWRSNLRMDSEEKWNRWFESYEKEILHYAKLAAYTDAELFCIGTELRTSVNHQPAKWKALIKKVRAIYQGKLTYAANWDDTIETIDFWEDLDYIGIQAYFPLTKNKNPDLEEIKKGWNRHIDTLEKLSTRFKKPILFTEIGYKSEASATIKPWEWDTFMSSLNRKKSDKTQQLAYQAMFEMLWSKDWYAGAYIWSWEANSRKKYALKSLNFSPQFKPAQNTIAKWYGKTAN